MGGILRKRIDELARGRFSWAEPMMAFSTDRIELQVLEGRTCQGEFEMRSENSLPLRGRVYSSNSRMECLTPQFEGESVRIKYEFHSEGLMEGDIQKGDFFIVLNQAEYNLSFVVTILRLYADTSMGPVRNLRDFTALAQENWEEAKKVFYSSCFKNILGEKAGNRSFLYQGLSKGRPSDLNLEEFLLACNLKEKAVCTCDTKEAFYYEVSEDLKYQFQLTRNTWGYLEFTVKSDGAFLQPEKSRITSQDFVGSMCTVNYYIVPKEMHPGKNYATLILESVSQRIAVNICASRKPKEVSGSGRLREIKESHVKLMNLYTDYRLKKIVTGKWAKASVSLLDELVVKRPKEPWYGLMKAQIYFLNGQRQETEWILSEFKREWKDKTSPQWGYYLYICTLMEREEVYVDKVTVEIEKIFLKHRENPILFWCLMFLEKEYTKDDFRKLKSLERRIGEGFKSPFLYVESFCLLQKDPLLFSRMGEFELEVLNWGRKNKVLNREIARQILKIFPERMGFKNTVFLLLQECYDMLGDDEALSAVCSYLIKNQKYGRHYFPWYEKGVLGKLRMTGLYEAYLLSMDDRTVMEVPKIILMYFKYNSQLDYRKKAVLYVNLIANQKIRPEEFQQYRQSMEVFAYEQMELSHMDDNLAVIYNEVVREGVHSPKLAEVLSNVMFVHKLTCLDSHALRVIVTDSAVKGQQVVPLTGGTAYFTLYSNDYSIFIEDSRGNRYSGSISYQLEKLMYPGKYLRDCMRCAPQKLPYLLYYFSSRKAVRYFEEKDLDYFRLVMGAEEVSDSYHAWVGAKMIRLLHTMGNTGEITRCLEKIDYGRLPREDRECIAETLISHKMYEQAYNLLVVYGREACCSLHWGECISHQIREIKFGENEMLLRFAAELFFQDVREPVITEYLARYYEGSTKNMELVWRGARELGIDTGELEERILVQMLYTTEFVDSCSDIYNSYEAGGNKKVKKAYLNYFSYTNFIKDMVPPGDLFAKLMEQMKKEGELPMVCELALLRHLAEGGASGEEEEEMMEAILQKYVYQGISFAFFGNLKGKMKQKYQLFDKYFLEYRSSPGKKVQMRYKSRENQDVYVTEEMTEMYEGIYVKEFILFFGESIQYYISEKQDGEMVVTESGTISGEKTDNFMEEGRYGRLNELFYLREQGSTKGLAQKMQRYRNLLERTEETFTIL
ncbi:MAG: hypothetical protein K2P76_00400 [Lachnospiraceae bacterium]|nr:hypothetical protein [Lachnospiraceae bacterium]